MPFDGLPDGLLSDLAKLRVALAGIGKGWRQCALGGPKAENHCALGWLLVATDWDTDEATRLALNYVYPALPEKARKGPVMESIYEYNDRRRHTEVVQLFKDAVSLAEKKA